MNKISIQKLTLKKHRLQSSQKFENCLKYAQLDKERTQATKGNQKKYI